MQLTVFNGSPRTGINNTDILLEGFLGGFRETPGNICTVHRLNKLASIAEAVDIFRTSDCIIIAFPLYVYAMPAGVKEFIEALEPLKGTCGGKSVGFIVQYGFPEAIHARPLEKYHEELAHILGCAYLGTVIKGGCDGLKRNSVRMNSRVLTGMRQIGRVFGSTGTLDRALLNAYAKPETEVFITKFIMRLIIPFINRFYWTAQLKANGALDKVYDRPYV